MPRDKNKHAEYMRRWRAAHPEYAHYMRQWRAANRKHVDDYSRQYYTENRNQQIQAVIRGQKARWDEFLLRCKVNSANHRYPGKLTLDGLKEVIERSGRKCCWCGKPDLRGRELTLEHLRPSNALEDLAIACNTCNAKRRELGRPHPSEEQAAKARKARRRYLANRDPQHVAIRDRIYRANRRYPGTLTREHYDEIVAKSDGKCHWCKRPISGSAFTLDHIKPNNGYGSIVAACQSCNASKKVIGKRTLATVKEHRTAPRPRPEPFTAEERVRRMRAATRRWRKNNPERTIELGAKYRDADREKFNKRSSEWKKTHRAQINAYRKTRRQQETAAAKNYRDRNRARVRARQRAWREANQETVNAYKRDDYQRNREKIRAAQAVYRLANREKINAQKREANQRKKQQPLPK